MVRRMPIVRPRRKGLRERGRGIAINLVSRRLFYSFNKTFYGAVWHRVSILILLELVAQG